MNNSFTFQISDLEKKADDNFIGVITVLDKNNNTIGELNYGKYKYKIYIDHVFVNEKFRGKGICPKMFSILIDKFPEIQMFMLENQGAIPSCKCYIKSFIDKKFDVYMGGSLFDYNYMRNNNMTLKQKSTVRIKINHNNNNFRKNTNTKKSKIETLCNQYSNQSNVDFLFVRR
jgi:predicted GNAT family acetyltransferase